MLLVVMYHRIGSGKHTNSKEMMQTHLEFLKKRYPIVLPGDPLPKRKIAVCLTFDDAYFDFYHYVFPILKKLKIRSLLGVPAQYILDQTILSPEKRLSVPYTMAMQDGFFDHKAPFCTWEELKEMVLSGFVEIASHSYMHCNLTFDFVNLNQEVIISKKIIEDNLSQPVTSFIYPFGKYNPDVHKYVAKHYPYAFRIGSAINWGWGNGKKPLNRIVGDQMLGYSTLFKFSNLAKYILKRL